MIHQNHSLYICAPITTSDENWDVIKCTLHTKTNVCIQHSGNRSDCDGQVSTNFDQCIAHKMDKHHSPNQIDTRCGCIFFIV